VCHCYKKSESRNPSLHRIIENSRKLSAFVPMPHPLGMGRGTVVPAGKPPTNGITAADLVVIIVPRISLPTLNLGLKKWG